MLSKEERHTGARCFDVSGAVGDDVEIARQFLEPLIDLLGRNANGTFDDPVHFFPRARLYDIEHDSLTGLQLFSGTLDVDPFFLILGVHGCSFPAAS